MNPHTAAEIKGTNDRPKNAAMPQSTISAPKITKNRPAVPR
jgi:hypothetical protein